MSLFHIVIKGLFKQLLRLGFPLGMGVVFCACLDVPNSPDVSHKIQTVEVFAKQFDKTIESPIKINANDSAQLIAQVNPGDLKKQVRYFWYKNDEILDSGSSYKISTTMMQSPFTTENFIPDRIVVVDKENNQLEQSFKVIVNSPPQLFESTKPAHNDTLYGDSTTPFTFQWLSVDNDELEILTNFLEIDGTLYNVGTLSKVQQSGFAPGRHTFRIIVQDSQGDKDSLETREFFVSDTLEAK